MMILLLLLYLLMLLIYEVRLDKVLLLIRIINDWTWWIINLNRLSLLVLIIVTFLISIFVACPLISKERRLIRGSDNFVDLIFERLDIIILILIFLIILPFLVFFFILNVLSYISLLNILIVWTRFIWIFLLIIIILAAFIFWLLLLNLAKNIFRRVRYCS
jgi:hypothetical protein